MYFGQLVPQSGYKDGISLRENDPQQSLEFLLQKDRAFD